MLFTLYISYDLDRKIKKLESLHYMALELDVIMAKEIHDLKKKRSGFDL